MNPGALSLKYGNQLFRPWTLKAKSMEVCKYMH